MSILRQNRDVRSLQTYRELRNKVYDGTDAKNDAPHKLAIDVLIPRIVERQKNAVAVDRRLFNYYQRMKVGRRCSCFGVEHSPDSLCQICWGTSVVGGYEKYGMKTEIIDVTKQNVNCVNVHPAYELGTRPVLFTLDEGALKGFIETDINLYHNQGIVDLIQVITAKLTFNNSIKAYIKTINDVSWVPLTQENLTLRILADKLFIRVEFSRTDNTIPPPLLSHLLIRYQEGDIVVIRGDIASRNESVTLAEFGIYDSFSSIPIYFDSTVKKFTTEDFLVRLEDMTRWKIIETNANRPSEILTSTQITARYVQNFEAYSRIP